VARIWPPYFLALIVALAGMFVDPALRANLTSLKPILWSFPAFVANYTIPGNGAPLSLLVMWSLCFEEQFYVILIAMYLLGTRQLTKYIVGAALLSIVVRVIATTVHPEWFSIFMLQMELHWRFDAIAWGCLAWIYHAPLLRFWGDAKHRWLSWPILALVLLACSVDPQTFPQRSVWYLALAPLFTALVSALTFAGRFWLARVLSWSPLVFIGSISYEVYLSHISVFRILARLRLDHLPWLYYPLTFASSIFVGWLFHRIFSKPSQRMLRSWLDRPAPGRASTLAN
jgi:peptidoglycan/LPS O-acetylase OafA/YrhL